MTERECTYLICRMETVGPVYFDRLLAYYGTAEAAWRQSAPPLTDRQTEEWRQFHRRETECRYCRELESLHTGGSRFLMRSDDEFPREFLTLYDCPIGIFVRGRLPAPGGYAAAMVGARRCSPYGRDAALRLGRELAERNITVVSGMAAGIDSHGQWSALQAGGMSVAVLGSGIDVCYPVSNRNLYRRLCEDGCVVSEYGPGTQGLPFHFPIRNRLISALSRIVLVIEARERSGSLITVDRALEQGRDVLALPGRVGDPLSVGCNNLIRQGAGILTSVEDVLEALGLSGGGGKHQTQVKAPAKLTEEQARVYALLTTEPVHQDVLAAALGIKVSRLLTVLWELETAGVCRQCSPGTYMKRM